jgi:large subunit ribosomal protein L21
MYAIIRAGGKQAKVRSGDVIEVERVKNAGDTVEFQPILVVDDEGATHSDSGDLANAVVTAKVLGEVKGDKVDIFKYKNKTGYRRHMGHRQTFTQLEITGIEMKTAKKAAAKKTTRSKTETAATAEGAASEEE